MGWSGGTFSRVHDWTDDAGSAINIEASRMDAEDDNFEAGINACIHKAGQNTATADLPMGGFNHSNVGNATARNEYASAADVQDQDLIYAVDTGAADAYVITCSPAFTALEEGMRVVFRSSATNTGASTLAVNGLAATAIQTPDGNALTAGMIVTGGYYEVTYDANGSRFVMTSPHSFQPVVTAGSGLTGGGTLPASVTLNVGAGTGISVAADSISTNDGAIVHDNLSGFVANEHIDHSGVSISGGNGLTGGGAITTSQTLNVGAGTGISVAADSVAVSAQLQDLHNVGVVDAADKMLVSSGSGTWTYETAAQVLTTIGAQPLDADLTTLGNLAKGIDFFIVANGSTWEVKSGSGARDAMGAQTQDDVLDDLSALTAVSGADQFIVSTGSGTYAHESVSDVRTTLRTAPTVGTYKSADQTYTSTLIADDTHLQVPIDGAGYYRIEALIYWSLDGGTKTQGASFGFRLNGSTLTGSDNRVWFHCTDPNNEVDYRSGYTNLVSAQDLPGSIITQAGDQILYLNGLVQMAGAGTLIFRFAKETSGNDVTVKTKSYLMATELLN